MRKLFLLVLIIGISTIILRAQIQIEQFPSTKLSMPTILASDEGGNLFIGLLFKGNLDINNQTFSEQNSAYLLIKRQPNGSIEWVKQCPFVIFDMEAQAGGVKILAQGAKPFEFMGKSYKAERYGAFLMELNASGELLYYEEFSSTTANVFAVDMDMDLSGNTAILLSMDKDVNIQGVNISPGMQRNGVVIMLNKQNNHQWILPFAGGDSFITGIWASAIAIDKAGAVYLAGNMSGAGKFGDLSKTTSKTVFGPGEELFNSECFLLKLAANGNTEFVKTIVTDANITDIELTEKGSLIIAGYFKGIVAGDQLGISLFGDKEYKSTLDESGSVAEDGFIASFTPDGSLIWVARSNGPATDRILDIAIDCQGNIYGCGMAMQNYSFSGSTGTSDVFINAGTDMDKYNSDAVLVKLDSQGALQWAKMGGSAKSDRIDALCFDRDNIRAGGFFYGNGTFDMQSVTISSALYEGLLLTIPVECGK